MTWYALSRGVFISVTIDIKCVIYQSINTNCITREERESDEHAAPELRIGH